VVEKLKSYHWPGNVRELKNILERAVILSEKGPIKAEHIAVSSPPDLSTYEERLKPLIGEKTMPEIEKILIKLAVRQAGGNKSKASKLLGITRRTLYSRMEKHGLTDQNI
jgi:DNA-binding NtrC family response regulator